MPAPRAGGARFVSRQFLYLMPADLRELALILRAASPKLRMVVSGFGPKVVIPELTGVITYVEDIDCPDDRFRFAVWLEPENWKPEWRRDTNNAPYLTGPELSLRLRPCSVYPSPWTNMAGEAPRGRAANEYLFLDEGRLEGVYYPRETEKEAFLRRVRRIFDKYTTNRCCTVEPETLKPKFISTKGAMDRIGAHAAAWSMAHPRHFLGRNLTKPIEWAQKCPEGWRPD